jgi:hypothetical protein
MLDLRYGGQPADEQCFEKGGNVSKRDCILLAKAKSQRQSTNLQIPFVEQYIVC